MLFFIAPGHTGCVIIVPQHRGGRLIEFQIMDESTNAGVAWGRERTVFADIVMRNSIFSHESWNIYVPSRYWFRQYVAW